MSCRACQVGHESELVEAVLRMQVQLMVAPALVPVFSMALYKMMPSSGPIVCYKHGCVWAGVPAVMTVPDKARSLVREGFRHHEEKTGAAIRGRVVDG